MTDKKIIYIDMDGTLVDFASGIEALKHLYPEKDPKSHDDNWDDVPGIFLPMKPMPGAIEAVHKLVEAGYDVNILTTAPWKNPTAWADKVSWVHLMFKNFDDKSATLYKKVTVSHRKNLLRGHYLIDDRAANGAKEFGEIEGQTWIQFGNLDNKQGNSEIRCRDWDDVLEYFGIGN